MSGNYLWHYTGAKEAFTQKRDDGRVDIIGPRGNVIHTSPTARDASKWAREHGYRLSR